MLENNVSNTNWNTYNIEREGGTSHNSAMSRDIKYNEADHYNSNNETNALNDDNCVSNFHYRLKDNDDFRNDNIHQPLPVFHGDDIISDKEMLENNVSNTNWNTYNIEREGGTSHNSAMSR